MVNMRDDAEIANDGRVSMRQGRHFLSRCIVGAWQTLSRR